MSGSLISVFANQRQFATVPGAPTIGTATATGSTTATVTYTAPASNGGSTITLYTATSSPSGITGTLSTSGSGTITVSGLAPATTYTFTVSATNAIGQGPASSSSNSVTPLPVGWPGVIGSAYQGGFFAGQINVSSSIYNLVIAPKSTGQATRYWKYDRTATSGTSSVIDGPTNSSNMNNANHPAAQFCEGLSIGGYTDWYMPAKNELEVLYYYLKPSTNNNNTSSGSNANAVSPEPISTNYTTGSPTQTTASDFQAGGTEAFPTSGPITFWSSTENGDEKAFRQDTNAGLQGSDFKDNDLLVRAIRRVAA